MILTYNGVNIEQRDTDGYVNATQLCQANGKRINNWYQNQSAKDYIKELSVVTGIPATELLITVQGGDPTKQGTWVHPLIAIAIAQWVSPAFHLWCNANIKTLIEKGEVRIKPYSGSTHIQRMGEILDGLVESFKALKELEERQAHVEETLKDHEALLHQHDSEIDRIFNPNGHYFSVMGYANKIGVKALPVNRAASLGKIATKICSENAIPVEQLNDPRFGKVNSYPESVLEHVFSEFLP